MKNVMKMAWEIAREGQKKFGGMVKEYLAEALRMVWAIVKGGKAELVIKAGSRKWPSSVKVVGGQEVSPVEEDYNEKVFKLANGIYEVCNAGDISYVKVANGQAVEIEESEATVLPALEGSEKQIAWAKKIRAEFIVNMERIINSAVQRSNGNKSEGLLKVERGYANALNNQASASYWINNRAAGEKAIVAQNV